MSYSALLWEDEASASRPCSQTKTILRPSALNSTQTPLLVVYLLFYLRFFAYRIIFSGVENPTYLKEGTADKVKAISAAAGVGLGVVCVLWGTVNMIFAIGKEKR